MDQAPLSVNDIVEISIPEQVIVKGALLVYLLPLCLLLTGSMLGQNGLFGEMVDSEAAAILGAILGLSMGFLFVRLYTLWNRGKQALCPHLVRRVSPH